MSDTCVMHTSAAYCSNLILVFNPVETKCAILLQCVVMVEKYSVVICERNSRHVFLIKVVPSELCYLCANALISGFSTDNIYIQTQIFFVILHMWQKQKTEVTHIGLQEWVFSSAPPLWCSWIPPLSSTHTLSFSHVCLSHL